MKNLVLKFARFSTSSPALNQFRRRRPVLPSVNTNITPNNAQEAVDNILYNVPQMDKTPSQRFSCQLLIQDIR
jgi:hypothetical protein